MMTAQEWYAAQPKPYVTSGITMAEDYGRYVEAFSRLDEVENFDGELDALNDKRLKLQDIYDYAQHRREKLEAALAQPTPKGEPPCENRDEHGDSGCVHLIAEDDGQQAHTMVVRNLAMLVRRLANRIQSKYGGSDDAVAKQAWAYLYGEGLQGSITREAERRAPTPKAMDTSGLGPEFDAWWADVR